MMWTTANDVRLISGLTTTDIVDDDLNSLIKAAQKEVLLQVNIRVTREEIEYIDRTRENKIDGSNKTYYIKNWNGNFISDYNYDLSVDTSDLTLVAVDNNDATESSVSIASITYNEGKFAVTTEQDNVNLLVTYAHSPFDPVTPDPLLKLATEYLAGAYAYMRVDSSQVQKVKFGNFQTTKGIGKDSAYSFLYDKYMDIIRQLNESASGGAIWGESHVLI